MQNKILTIGTLLLFVAITSMTFRPAAAVGALSATPGSIPLGGSVDITQTMDSTGEVKSFAVTEPDGDKCKTDGGPVSEGSPLTRTYPGDFTIDEVSGDGICDTSNGGTYEAMTLVKPAKTDDLQTLSSSNNDENDDECDEQDGENEDVHQDEHESDQGLTSQHNNDNEEVDDENNNDDDGNDNDDNQNDDGCVKNVVEFQTSFFVLPESPVGVLALMGSSLAALGGFYFFKK